jgi:7,8-dihydroneopterin aldolase/epimerase/oxygenase
MNGAIRIRRMRFWGRHGVTELERASPQEIELDVELITDCSRAAETDRLADAVDYVDAYRMCERIVTERSFALLEALAEECLRELMRDPRVERATVRARKPGLLDGATPEVELTRTRPRE